MGGRAPIDIWFSEEAVGVANGWMGDGKDKGVELGSYGIANCNGMLCVGHQSLAGRRKVDQLLGLYGHYKRKPGYSD